MISNPAKWFISGNETEEFIYEGGKDLFHFSVRGLPTFEHHIFLNLIFFADSEEHAANILERMLKAHLDSSERYKSDHPEVLKEICGRLKFMENVLKYKDLWQFSEAPKNQFYKVGWASNDTIL